MLIRGLTVKGIEVRSTSSAISSDEYFNLVSLLLPGTGTNEAQNNTFVDGSTNNFTVTRNGNTTQGTFSPFSQTGWSNYFDGSGDYLTVADNSAWDFGSGDFTIECWVYNTGTNGFIVSQTDNNTASGTSFILFISSGALVGLIYYNSNSVGNITDPTSFPLNQWVHIALVRSSNTITLYLNGTSKGTFNISSGTVNNSSQTLAIGARNNGGDPVTGYISNLRIVKGTAVYTSAFTPPSAPLTAITNTSLLTCQSNRFVDNSANAFVITVNGNPAVQAFAPFDPTTAYAAATVGGSGYFDGTGDYLSVASNAALGVGSGDFTLECWVYLTANFDATGQGIITAAYDTNFALIGVNTGAGNKIDFYVVNTLLSTGTNYISLNTWTHIAAVRSSGTTKIYFDGVEKASSGSLTGTGAAATLYIGTLSHTLTQEMTGYISSARLVKGSAVYTSAFTPPTAPLTAITNTSLLLNYTNGGITDVTAKNVLETVGSAQISTAQSKFGGSSMAFDGTGDFLIAQNNPALQLGSDNFTIDGWVNFNLKADWAIASKGLEWSLCGDNNRWVFQVNAGGTAQNVFVIAFTPTVEQWYHFACVRNGSTTTMYINGNSIGSGTSININNSTGVVYVGRYALSTGYDLNGYIDDLRITKGVARYTSNFTPPTQAFPTQ